MSDGVPLHQILEPGEYRVEWQFPTPDGGIVTLPGDLELQPDKPPRANAFGYVPVSWKTDGTTKSAAFQQTYEARTITGTLLNGLVVVLIDTSVLIWASERAIIYSRAVLVGRELPESLDLVVSSIEVQVEGLDAVAGKGPIREVKFPSNSKEGRRYLDWSWQAFGQPESTQVWSDQGAEAELRFYNAATISDPFFFRVTFSPIVLFQLAEPVAFDGVFEGWIEPLRRIISLSTGRRERITYLAVTLATSGSEHRQFQVYGSALHQSPYASRRNDVMKIERAFFLSPKDMSLLDMLRRWQQLNAEHHPLLETYGSMMFAPDQHPRSRFLLLLQALEGLYGYESKDVSNKRDAEHAALRKASIAEATNALSRETLRFLRKYLAQKPPNSLDQAIVGILAAVPVDIIPALEKSALITEVMADARKPKNVHDCLRLVRNDLAHGNRGYDARALSEVVDLLDGVVQAHVLRLLGCSEDTQRKSQERRR